MFWTLDTADPQRTALVDGPTGNHVSYADLQRDCHEARQLLDDALETKGVILMAPRNSSATVGAYLAALQAGHAVLLTNPAQTPRLRRRLVDRFQPDLIWSSDPGAVPERFERTANHWWLSKQRCSTQLPDQLALLLSTSGSTGSPKLVRLSYDNLSSNAAAIADYLCLTPSDRAITSLPLQYTYGLSVLHSHLAVGASMVCTEASVVSHKFWKQFRDHSCTSLAGVPFTFEMLERVGFDRMELPSLRYMTQAGGAMADERIEHFRELGQRKGFELYVMYGQTEATARMSYVPPEHLAAKTGSVGRPIPGGQLYIERDGRRARAPFEPGELVYRGPNVMMGYASSRAELAAPPQHDDILHTGDLGYVDDDGFFYITGRRKRFLKIYGNRVNLDEVEHGLETLLDLPVACVGRDDLLEIVVETTDDKPLSRACQLAADHWGLHRRALSCTALAEIPRTASGKKNYSMLGEKRDD